MMYLAASRLAVNTQKRAFRMLVFARLGPWVSGVRGHESVLQCEAAVRQTAGRQRRWRCGPAAPGVLREMGLDMTRGLH
jgi:hypothetical protein